MAEMTAAEARARLKPFEEGLAVLVQALDLAARAEAAEGQALARTQDAERRIAQAVLRVTKAESDAAARVAEAEEKTLAAELVLQKRLGETKATLEGQVATLTAEVQAERQRLEQVGQDRGRAERDRDAAIAGYRQQAEAERRSLQEQIAAFERTVGDLEARIAAKRGEYREIVEKIQAIKV